MTAQSDGEPPDGKFSHLRTSKSSQRLNQVEKIRAHGSTGKSSVLEGVTGIPFPRQEGLCTRFPSEINLRHTECESVTITASIRPHISRPAEVQQTLSAYRKQLKDMSELPGVIEEVSRLMNIRGYCDNENASAFSVDVLRIEVTGPIGLHLSVVDLPGLISVANEEQTEEDVEAVHNMPDLINHGSEAKIVLVAKNKDNIKLKLGFFLLKNPSPAELKECVTMAARSNLERRFFSGPAWANQNLDMSRVGAENLRIFLQDLLDTHIERELPKVREEIKKLLAERDAELRSLGEARPTTDLIRNFLTALSMRFYELLQAALDGNYHSIDTRFFSESDISRLRARVQKSNTKFATYMRESGKRRKLKIEVNRDNTVPESDDSEDDKLDDITTQLIVNKAGMVRWVKEAYARTKGKELPGNYNSALLAELFHEQSRRWPIIAESHIDAILKIVSEWIQLAVERLIPEESMRAQVHSILQQWLEETEKNALSELEKLIEDERRSPLTYNHYYTDNVQKARLDAQKKAVENAVSAERDVHGKLHVSNVHVDIQKFIAAVGSRITVDMDEQACHEAITELDAYYKVTMKTFVDNVARQVIERHVIAPLPNAFSPNSVSQLSEEDLLRIGSESEKQIARREKLALQVQGLKKSLRDLQKSSL
ncbi:dynamin central region domain-containing protein [Trichoderma breve]|uniref:Dynamin central region domain-containing protein n=1 Tax=Trichoderma breve TaxID=2034170 RepID=A0A9W9B890_9HYPO|nr:dynamin central region domain-containing protein [Trichoderma breve]KAJ4856509.1 dynamin central region domain-containing protein [Trichoderma breve]